MKSIGLIDWLRLTFKGLFHGLKAADNVVSSSESFTGGNVQVVQEKGSDSALGDLLAGVESQRAMEYRDAYYRDLIEANHYRVHIENIDDDSKPMIATAKKKKRSDYLIKGNYYNPENVEIRVVQYNTKTCTENTLKPIPLIKITRGFLPRFHIEDYVGNVVVRHDFAGNRWFVDLYTTSYASQFGKVDAILIAELNRMEHDKVMKSDITDIEALEFVTDRAAGEDDLRLFRFVNMKFIGIDRFDGHFILRYEVDVEQEGFDITGKYRTKELDEKYLTNAPREGKSIDLMTAVRRMKKDNEKETPDNFETVTFNLS